MKKTIIFILLFILILFVQLFIISGKTLFGVNINLILIFVITFNLYFKGYKECIISLIIGLFCDIIYQSIVPIYMISYFCVSIVIFLFFDYDKNYDKFSIIYIIGICSVVYEIIKDIILCINYNIGVSVIYIIYQSIVSAIYNIAIGYIIYNIFFIIINKLEDNNKRSNYYIGGGLNK